MTTTTSTTTTADAGTSAVRGGALLYGVAAASAGAAAIHFAIVGEHFHEWWVFGVFFAALAWAQVLWAAAIVRWPHRGLLAAGAVVQLVVVGLYVVTRTTGLPFGPTPGEAEAAAFVDILCTALGGLAAVGAVALLARREPARRPGRRAVFAASVLTLAIAATTSVALASATPESDGMGMGMTTGMDMGASSVAAAAAVSPSAPAPVSLATSSPAGPVVMPSMSMAMSMEPGMAMAGPPCTTTPTTGEEQAAVQLVDQTVAATTSYQSLDAAKAAGFVPVTPAGKPVVHYVSPANIAATTDGNVLNPATPQSLVYANTPNGPVLVAVMYIMPMRSTATPPTPGGCLTQWHVHTNLCFDATHRVVGVDGAGGCPAGSTVQVTQPMIHVWLAPVPGGPLAVDAGGAEVWQAAQQLPAVNPASERA